jgi:hypothetical protein
VQQPAGGLGTATPCSKGNYGWDGSDTVRFLTVGPQASARTAAANDPCRDRRPPPHHHVTAGRRVTRAIRPFQPPPRRLRGGPLNMPTS